MASSSHNPTTVVIGIGNDLRHDDGIGLYVAKKIEERSLPNVKTVIGIKDGPSLLYVWEGYSEVYIIDAVQKIGKPGEILRFDALKENIPVHTFSAKTTHVFNLSSVIKLAESLDQLPEKLIIYGIIGADFSPGDGLTDEVQTGGDNVVEKILSELKS